MTFTCKISAMGIKVRNCARGQEWALRPRRTQETLQYRLGVEAASLRERGGNAGVERVARALKVIEHPIAHPVLWQP
jgi:hypothetical protein